jgi:hypothetical protein
VVRVIVFALIALGWWLAAPDKFTAAARTASGTGLKAAGTGAKVHWNAGRDGRKLGRNDRRDRWHAKGGWWRKLLGLEHGAVVTGKAVKGTGKLAAAAVKPVPGAIRDGWRAGQARHGARTAGRPVPVALDPPWWRKPDPAPVPDETGQDSPQDSGTALEDTPRDGPGQPAKRPAAATVLGEKGAHCSRCLSPVGRHWAECPTCQATLAGLMTASGRYLPPADTAAERIPPAGRIPTDPEALGELMRQLPTGRDEYGEPYIDDVVLLDRLGRTPYNPGYTKDGLTIDDEDEIRARHPVLTQIQPEPLTEAQRRFWTLRDRGYPGPINQDGWPVPEPGALGGFIRDPVPYLQREPIDPPAGTDPDGTTTPSTDNPGGTVSPTPFGAELDDLTSVQDFAVKVADMAEESDFAQLVSSASTPATRPATSARTWPATSPSSRRSPRRSATCCRSWSTPRSTSGTAPPNSSAARPTIAARRADLPRLGGPPHPLNLSPSVNQ